MKRFLKEFETFALHGNAMDLAIGVVIGAAFNQITNSLVANVITPPVGLLLGGFDFAKLSLPLGGSAVIAYGLFIQALVNFIIIAFALFVFVKIMNRLRLRENAKTAPAKSPEVRVLEEIRDELRRTSRS
ncbi:MAG: large conductance mechanosensitive channel protein MscL [Patescibacteria group bacterium]|nr:large conductance mechanosensitive channel protein MscL [Patescibacteria group bacterium]MDE1966009.1 large conductance mechanosensitive channel protein MscL [Patescibacteria group bacterium]